MVDLAGVAASLSGCRGRRLCRVETEELFCPLHCAMGLRVSGCLFPCALQDPVAHTEFHRSTSNCGGLCSAIDLLNRHKAVGNARCSYGGSGWMEWLSNYRSQLFQLRQ